MGYPIIKHMGVISWYINKPGYEIESAFTIVAAGSCTL
jgi:hypothetical protein